MQKYNITTSRKLEGRADVKDIAHRYNEKHRSKLEKTLQRYGPLPVYVLIANSVTAKRCVIKDVSVPDTT